jgi:FtsH-binding integral membrane protein
LTYTRLPPERLARPGPALFAATMALVAGAAGCFVLGAYVGSFISTGLALLAYIAVFCCLLALRFAARGNAVASMILLGVLGLLVGVALAPTVAYSAADPQALIYAGGATALFTAACAAAAYLGEPDLPALGRLLAAEVLAVCGLGVALVLERAPRDSLVNAGIAIAAYAALGVIGFGLLRRVVHIRSAPLLAASILAAPVSPLFFVASAIRRRRGFSAPKRSSRSIRR